LISVEDDKDSIFDLKSVVNSMAFSFTIASTASVFCSGTTILSISDFNSATS
jgi:hypothetical protein